MVDNHQAVSYLVDMTDQINELVTKFTSDLNALIRQSALAAATAALGGSAPETASEPVETAKKPSAKKAAPKTAKKVGTKAKGEKRDPADLAKLVEKLHAQIKKDPGSSIETIGAAMETPTKDLSLPIKKLIAAKRVTTKGAKRATRYFPKG